MGGVNNNENFILNCSAWKNFYNNSLVKAEIDKINITKANIAIAPVTGAEQNIGFCCEEDFYLPYFTSAFDCGIDICVGDGAPDEKLEYGINAVSKLNKKSYFILKPYQNTVLYKRVDKVSKFALAIGIDVDAYNIVTMRNQVCLEKKTVESIKEFTNYSKLPFIIKGVFTKEDIDLCKKLKPEIIVVSNHGGRIETQIGSTCDFLQKHAKELKSYCKELWVDGGIRTKTDIKCALYLGATKVLIARPVISALCKGGQQEAKKYLETLFN